MKNTNKGFTLIELSIVLVIISLIVGGIIGGRALIKSAEIQNIIKEANEIQTILRTFVLQYDDAPGDLRDASQYWPSYGDNYCTGAFSGNGDGIIYHDYESRYVWVHLNAADLLPGRSNDSLYCTTRLTESGDGEWRIWDTDNFGGGSAGKTSENVLLLSPTGNVTGAIFTPKDALTIDRKMDDGKPYTGKVRGRDASGLPGDCIASSDYIKSDPELECRLEFVIGRL